MMVSIISHVLIYTSICRMVNTNPIVVISDGILEGKYVNSTTRMFSSFTKIPYAKPPMNDLRFKAPQPANSWMGTLNAKHQAPVCPQTIKVIDYVYKGEEDCLYLNVFTPQLKQAENRSLPVMVFFHGGAFMIGRGDSLDPRFLLNKDIVLVTLNYRIGALGFFSTGDEVVPGNNGLKDQNMAILWVKRNIRQFGGNPKQIILFGQSAGGTSSHYHMLSPLSRDLISGIISQSGVATSFWGFAPGNQNHQFSRSLAKLLKCPTSSHIEMVACLRDVPVRDIITNQNQIPLWNSNRIATYRPVIEPNITGAFIVEHPLDMIKKGDFAKVPFIVGITANDGCLVSPKYCKDPPNVARFNLLFDKIVSNSLEFHEADNKECILKQIKAFYFDNKNVTYSDTGRNNVTNLFTDGMFLSASNTVVHLHKKYHPVYNYVFGYRGTHSYSEVFGDRVNNYGVCHGDDMIYLSYVKNFGYSFKLNNFERFVSNNMVGLWTNFAIDGNPTPENHKWKTVSSDKLEYFFITDANNSKMLDNLYQERMEFWKSLRL